MPPGRKRRRRSVGRQRPEGNSHAHGASSPRVPPSPDNGRQSPEGNSRAYSPSSPRASPSPLRAFAGGLSSGGSAAVFSREQLHRALSFVDVSADGLITHKELRGSLMSTDMQAFDSKDFSRLLLRNVSPVQLYAPRSQELHSTSFSRLLLAASPATSSNNSSSPPSSSSASSYSYSQAEYRYEDVFENLVRLLEGHDPCILPWERQLAERAVEHLLRQREDDAASYEVLRFFYGATCFLVPIVGLIMGGIGGCCLGPESNAVWIPWMFRDSSVHGWKEESQLRMMLNLNNYIRRHTEKNIKFRITSVVFRLEIPGIERGVNIHMKINETYASTIVGHANQDKRGSTSKNHEYQAPAFFISCPGNLAVQRKANAALGSCNNVKALLLGDISTSEESPWEFHIQKAVMSRLKSTFVDTNVRPLATSIGVWEVRMHCHFFHEDPVDSSLSGLSSTSSPDRGIKPVLYRSSSEATAQELSGSEVVYQHASQTIEFHNSVTEYDYGSASRKSSTRRTLSTSPVSATDSHFKPPTLIRHTSEELYREQEFKSDYRRRIERIQRGFITIVRRSVLSRSWWRMHLHHVLLFSSTVQSMMLWYVARFSADGAYACAMPHTPTPKDMSKCARMKSLVSSAEILRVIALFLILGLMSSMKNMWLMNDQSTKTGRLSSREAVYVKAFKDIADLPRFGLHHRDVGRLIPCWMAAFWVAVPILRRMDGNNFGIWQLLSRLFQLVLDILKHCVHDWNGLNGKSSISNIAGEFLHRQTIVVQMPGTGSKMASPPVAAKLANVSITEVMGASFLGTEHGLTGWSTLDLASLGAMLVAISCIISSILARSCSVFLSFPCWKGMLPLLHGWNSKCGRKMTKGFSCTYENIFLLSVCGAGFIAPGFLALVFSEQSQPSKANLMERWDGDYLGDDSGGSEMGVSQITYTVCVIFFTYWVCILIWFVPIRKLLLRDTWFQYLESTLILLCCVLVLTVNLVRALPMIFASINGSQDEQILPKSTNMAVVMATAATAYILISTFLTIMHGNYVYFERLTKIMDLFTKASMHASWYTFFRNFSRSSRERGCSLLRCLAKCQRCESVVEKLRDIEAKRMTDHRVVIERVKKGPINAQGTGRHSKMAFTAFDLSSKADVIYWNQTRMRLIQECNSAESQVRMVSLHFLTLITTLLAGVTILRRFVELLDARQDHTGRLRMVETSITNSSNVLMQGFLFLCILSFLPTIYQRLRLAQLQEHHISLLVDAKHRVRILVGASGLRRRHVNHLDANGLEGTGSSGNDIDDPPAPLPWTNGEQRQIGEDFNEQIDDERSEEELQNVIELLEESINKLENSDVKPILFGVELEALSARNVFSMLASVVGVWCYFETRGAVGG